MYIYTYIVLVRLVTVMSSITVFQGHRSVRDKVIERVPARLGDCTFTVQFLQHCSLAPRCSRTQYGDGSRC